ncbi:hypothetical protein QJS04_geneDACA021411 [Acorus gramineus]|uniref:Uncharacterized protein n=1 Tax=Acorus gramineus TaxID=55184 RepID=A0AAV9A6Z1_ACOGR|nr:hypothetical protein QJS04_geneDACA021411 [Acorus gramineus]
MKQRSERKERRVEESVDQGGGGEDFGGCQLSRDQCSRIERENRVNNLTSSPLESFKREGLQGLSPKDFEDLLTMVETKARILWATADAMKNSLHCRLHLKSHLLPERRGRQMMRFDVSPEEAQEGNGEEDERNHKSMQHSQKLGHLRFRELEADSIKVWPDNSLFCLLHLKSHLR